MCVCVLYWKIESFFYSKTVKKYQLLSTLYYIKKYGDVQENLVRFNGMIDNTDW